MNRLANIIVVFMACATCLGSGLPANLSHALQTQAEELSPLSIQWTDNGQPQQIFWQHGCVYCGSAPDATSFDGHTIYLRFDNAGQQVVLKKSRDRMDSAGRNVKWFQCRYLDAAGWELASTSQELLRPRCRSIILKLIDAGNDVNRIDDVQQDGRLLKRIELVGLQQPAATAIRFRFYVDPQLGNAIRRREEYVGGKLRAQIDSDDFQRLAARDIWLPRRCLIKTPGQSHDLRVAAISLDSIPPNQFVLAADRIGALISDETVPGGQLNFQIPPAPDTLDFDELMASAEPGGVPATGSSRAWLAIPGLLLAWLGWRFRAILIDRRH